MEVNAGKEKKIGGLTVVSLKGEESEHDMTNKEITKKIVVKWSSELTLHTIEFYIFIYKREIRPRGIQYRVTLYTEYLAVLYVGRCMELFIAFFFTKWKEKINN